MPDDPSAELTVLIVSYNTRALTLKCLETLYANTRARFRAIVVDNASQDGSAEAIAARFPQVTLIASAKNLGFAAANNLAAAQARSDWLLLLNPDTETYPGGVDALLAFSKANPQAGITGGRTYYPDGSLNPYSCSARLTLWSTACRASGLSAAFPRSPLFNPEAYGGWQRDNARRVDIVVGCFLMIRRSLWDQLGGFDLRYFMYGEDYDLCLRAGRLGYRPMLCPEAKIMHLVGASTTLRARRHILVAKSRVSLIHDHWHPALVPLGVALTWLWGALRTAAALSRAVLRRHPSSRESAAQWREIWRARRSWLQPY